MRIQNNFSHKNNLQRQSNFESMAIFIDFNAYVVKYIKHNYIFKAGERNMTDPTPLPISPVKEPDNSPAYVTLADGSLVTETPIMTTITYSTQIIEPSKIRLITEIDFNISCMEMLISKIKFELEQVKSQKATFLRQDAVDAAKHRAKLIQEAAAQESLKKKKLADEAAAAKLAEQQLDEQAKAEPVRKSRAKKMSDDLL